MNTIWLKIKVWTKGIVGALLLIYILIFIAQNSGQTVKFWWFFGQEPETSLLIFTFFTFFFGVFITLLVRAALKTVRQIREIRERNRTARLEREVAEMRSKASMLKTRDTVEAPHSDVENSTEL